MEPAVLSANIFRFGLFEDGAELLTDCHGWVGGRRGLLPWVPRATDYASTEDHLNALYVGSVRLDPPVRADGAPDF